MRGFSLGFSSFAAGCWPGLASVPSGFAGRSVFSAGSAVQWLRDGLRAVAAASEVEALAASVADTGGVYLVPAFTGLVVVALARPEWVVEVDVIAVKS